MVQKPQAIFVGDHLEVGDALSEMKEEWDFYTPKENLKDFTNPGAQVIFLLDTLYEDNPTEFLSFIINEGKTALVAIVNYVTDEDEISSQINAYSDQLGLNNLNFGFIDSDEPIESLENVVQEFINKTDLIDVAQILLGEENEIISFDDDFDTDNLLDEDETIDEENSVFGRVIACTSGKGGAGKTSIALSLAIFLAKASINSVKEGIEDRPLKILVLDIDVKDGQVGFLTGHKTPVITNMLNASQSNYMEKLDETIIHDTRLNIDLLLAPKRSKTYELFTPEFYVEILTALKTQYDYIILDTSVDYTDVLLEKVSYPISDLIILVTELVVTSILSMSRWIYEETLPIEKGGGGIRKNKIGIVINKSMKDIGMPQQTIDKARQEVQIITAVPSNPRLVTHASNMRLLDKILLHPEMYAPIRTLAKVIVQNDSYELSDKIS